jgi:hypothetical protein
VTAVTKLPGKLAEQLIELQSDAQLKVLFADTELAEFWLAMPRSGARYASTCEIWHCVPMRISVQRDDCNQNERQISG